MKEYKLKELLEIKNGKDHSSVGVGNIPIFGSGGIMRYGDEFLYNDESILLPRKGSLSNIQYVNQPFWTVDTIYYSIINKEKAVPYYLYNYLRLLDLSKLNSGTGVPSMTYDSYYNIKVNLPEPKIQKQVANILSALDDKIELNNRINEVLEAKAKLLYDYWFVQFEFPASGASAPLSPLDGSRSPRNGGYKSSGGKMVYHKKLKREIPEGWEVKSLYAMADFHNGLACQKYRPETDDDEFLPVVKIREMKEGFSTNTEKVRTEIPDKNIINDGDILFSWSASLDVKIWSLGKAALNQHIFKVESDYLPKSFIYFQLLQYLEYFKAIAEARKTTMGHITIDHLKNSFIAVPPKDVIKAKQKILDTYFNQLLVLNKQNQHLVSLRDWLLPMLMNGQVGVERAYEIVDGEMGMVAEPGEGYGE